MEGLYLLKKGGTSLKVFKRFTTLVLAFVMAAMLAVSAYAATVVVKYKVYVYTSQLTFKQYDYDDGGEQ